jgi:hypothetical protein
VADDAIAPFSLGFIESPVGDGEGLVRFQIGFARVNGQSAATARDFEEAALVMHRNAGDAVMEIG